MGNEHTQTLRKTALYEHHRALGAKMAAFAGWEMPIQYKGIIAEHQAVRNAAGLFDVSHMGRILVEGLEAEAFLDSISTNKIIGKTSGSVTYTVLCTENGGCVDDVLIYKCADNSFFVIANAGNRQQDLEHLQRYAKGKNIRIHDRFNEEGILALQGPLAEKILSSFVPSINELKRMHFMQIGNDIISRTGYTGADGFEIYASHAHIVDWWEKLIKGGKPLGLEPVGIGARDTLRLEMGYALYGHEISATIAPNESIAAWTIKGENRDFLGKSALEAINQSPSKRSAYGVVLKDPGIAREGYPVFKNDQQIGVVTSGTFSPSIHQAIALVLVTQKLKVGEEIIIQVRQQLCRGTIVPTPFL